MDVKAKLFNLMTARGWSYYQLSKKSGVAWSTIRNMFQRGTEPTIPTLEALCRGLNITLEELLLGGDITELTDEQRELLSQWDRLDPDSKAHFLSIMRSINQSK